jgi:nucleoside-diphosphate-sugar epimerase
MKILVTGGSGFIGSRLVSHLTERGEEVHVLDLPNATEKRIQLDSVRVYSGSITNPVDVGQALEGCDRILHLAAYARNWAPEEQTFYDVNVRGTDVVLAAALKHGIRKVVHTSSNAALGPSNGVLTSESTHRSGEFFTPYERSKYLSEKLVRRYVERGLNVVIVNPTRVFGPGPINESNSVTKMIAWYLEGKWRWILGDGMTVGNYVYVDDLIEGYVRAMEYGISGENYILGGENVSFNDFFDMLSSVAKRRHRMLHLRGWLAMAFSRIEEFRSRHFRHYPLITSGWARTFLADWANSCGKAERDLGYVITPLREAMAKTVQWIEQNRDQQESLAWGSRCPARYREHAGTVSTGKLPQKDL